jgi:hypothetical protein
MAKTYSLAFASTTGNPAINTGLSPTFIAFSANVSGASFISVTPPGITEIPGVTGIYYFVYSPTLPIVWIADGGSVLSGSARYISGSLDPIQSVDEKMGTLSDSFGSTSVDPQSALGYLKRLVENFEGAAVFTKSTGTWAVYSRGSSTLIFQKTLTNTTTRATKS